jgi:hypothetical protein
MEDKEEIYRRWFDCMRKSYPFEHLRAVIRSYHEIDTTDVFRWMVGLAQALCKETGSLHMLPSFSGLSQRLAFYKSGCTKRTYRGKTCRRTTAGKRTKVRDNKRTFKLTHRRLLR